MAKSSARSSRNPFVDRRLSLLTLRSSFRKRCPLLTTSPCRTTLAKCMLLSWPPSRPMPCSNSKCHRPKVREREELLWKRFFFDSEVSNQIKMKRPFIDQNFRISLIILIAFGIPVLLAIICGCFVRCRNLRKLKQIFFLRHQGTKHFSRQVKSNG